MFLTSKFIQMAASQSMDLAITLCENQLYESITTYSVTIFSHILEVVF